MGITNFNFVNCEVITFFIYSRECVHFMVNFHLSAEGNKLRVVYRKYSIQFFGCVSSLVPANLPSDESCSSNN